MRAFLFAALLALCVSAGPVLAENAECVKQADAKKLAGAARNSFLKKCEADAGGAATAGCACLQAAAATAVVSPARHRARRMRSPCISARPTTSCPRSTATTVRQGGWGIAV